MEETHVSHDRIMSMYHDYVRYVPGGARMLHNVEVGQTRDIDVHICAAQDPGDAPCSKLKSYNYSVRNAENVPFTTRINDYSEFSVRRVENVHHTVFHTQTRHKTRQCETDTV